MCKGKPQLSCSMGACTLVNKFAGVETFIISGIQIVSIQQYNTLHWPQDLGASWHHYKNITTVNKQTESSCADGQEGQRGEEGEHNGKTWPQEAPRRIEWWRRCWRPMTMTTSSWAIVARKFLAPLESERGREKGLCWGVAFLVRKKRYSKLTG